MRNTTDRRHPPANGMNQVDDPAQGGSSVNRRKIRDRRMENLTLEERQLLLSEMPSLKQPGSD
jgi:hypothetical protein